jgi:chromosome segregation ATPase
MNTDLYDKLKVPETIAALQALNAKSTEYAALPTKAARAQANLTSTTRKLEKLKAELSVAEPELAKLQAKNQRDYDIGIKEIRAQLEKAWIDEEAANKKLGELDAAIRDRRAILDGLVGAMAQLMVRLGGKPDEGLIERLGSGEFHN